MRLFSNFFNGKSTDYFKDAQARFIGSYQAAKEALSYGTQAVWEFAESSWNTGKTFYKTGSAVVPVALSSKIMHTTLPLITKHPIAAIAKPGAMIYDNPVTSILATWGISSLQHADQYAAATAKALKATAKAGEATWKGLTGAIECIGGAVLFSSELLNKNATSDEYISQDYDIIKLTGEVNPVLSV